MNRAKMKFHCVCIDANDIKSLSDFYKNMLDYETVSEDEYHVVLKPKEDGPYLSFQRNNEYSPVIWPDGKGKPQVSEHCDFLVENLEEAKEWAIHCGAKLADPQYYKGFYVMIDPEGHPFCLFEED